METIILQWVSWQFLEMPVNILKAWKNFLKFGLYYFSIPSLLKTLFSPWHRYKWNYPRGFDIRKYFEVFISNLVSRFIGAVLRLFLIIFGIIFEIFIVIFGMIILLGWLFLPLLLIAGLVFGIKIII